MSILDDLRRKNLAEIQALTPQERMELAFALGEEDLRLYMRASGLGRPAALARLRAARSVGRTPSVSAAPSTS